MRIGSGGMKEQRLPFVWVALGALAIMLFAAVPSALAFHGPTNCELHEGTSGNDTFVTFSNCDHIFGFGGFDIAFSDGGRDGIKGGKDADDLSAQELNDTIFGEGGDDFLRGGDGFDVCRGGAGADSFFGCEDVR